MKSTRSVWFATHSYRNVTMEEGSQGAAIGSANVDPLYPRGWRQCLESAGATLDAHREILCTVPSGVGANLTLAVFVGRSPGLNGQAIISNLMPFSYNPPSITYAKPTPINAAGENITFYGTNLADNWGVRCQRFISLLLWCCCRSA
jgi:hypothetical protein